MDASMCAHACCKDFPGVVQLLAFMPCDPLSGLWLLLEHTSGRGEAIQAAK
jgi:hypothetical protein